MIRTASIFKGTIVLAACVLVLVALATPGPRHPVEFTLAATGGDSARLEFTLAPPSTGPTALAGPGGLGVIEDPDWPYRTALGFQALGSNTTAVKNTAIGYNALYLNEGSNNTAVGAFALGSPFSVSGSYNTGIGAGTFGGDPFHGVFRQGKIPGKIV